MKDLTLTTRNKVTEWSEGWYERTLGYTPECIIIGDYRVALTMYHYEWQKKEINEYIKRHGGAK